MNQKNKYIEGRVVTGLYRSINIHARLLSVTKFCHNGPCLEKMFLAKNSNQAVQDIEDGLKFC